MTETSENPYLEGDYHLDDEAIRFTGLDECIIGVDDRGYLAYCYNRMLALFMKREDWTEEEAEEWISFNVLGIQPATYAIIYGHEN